MRNLSCHAKKLRDDDVSYNIMFQYRSRKSGQLRQKYANKHFWVSLL